MNTSRGNFFYTKLTALTSSYKDNAFDFKFSSRQIKMSVTGGELQFILNGADDTKVDGLIKPGDGVADFQGLEANRIALKQVSGTVTEVRLWAYK